MSYDRQGGKRVMASLLLDRRVLMVVFALNPFRRLNQMKKLALLLTFVFASGVAFAQAPASTTPAQEPAKKDDTKKAEKKDEKKATHKKSAKATAKKEEKKDETKKEEPKKEDKK